MKEIINLENRKKIYDLLLKNPGLNLSKIAELLSMNVPLVDYHLNHMADNDLVIIVKEGGGSHKRYYIKGKTSYKDKKILGILRQETPLKIVIFLIKFPYSKHKDILNEFDLAASTLSYHINKLLKIGIIRYEESGPNKGYVINDKDEIINFLTRYRPSKVLNRFKETWDDDFSFL